MIGLCFIVSGIGLGILFGSILVAFLDHTFGRN